jgi:hypothetical protein
MSNPHHVLSAPEGVEGENSSIEDVNLLAEENPSINSYCSSDSDKESDGEEEEETPLPRDHSYLVGSSHPLMVDPSLRKRPRSDSTNKSTFLKLAILELNGIVLFPGSTIPVKLRDRSLIKYLGRQIELCRNMPDIQPEVRLGILTYETPESPRSSASQRSVQEQRLRSSWMRQRVDGTDFDQTSVSILEAQLQGGNEEEHHEGHAYLGRIGTIATIKCTHERTEEEAIDSLSSSHVWRRYEELNELVLTAVGTSRFRIISCVQEDNSAADYKVFKVEELNDEPMTRPPMRRFFYSRPIVLQQESPPNNPQSRHKQLAWNLSMITPIPHFVYESKWPWKLVDSLVAALKENQANAHLPSLGEINKDLLEPTKFSFWMASNMPFTQRERLSLLQMYSTFERLQIIYEKVKDLAYKESYLCCAGCEVRFTTVASVFTVGGAEGATSNYGKLKNVFSVVLVSNAAHHIVVGFA